MKKNSNRSHFKNQFNLNWFANDSGKKARVKEMRKQNRKEKQND